MNYPKNLALGVASILSVVFLTTNCGDKKKESTSTEELTGTITEESVSAPEPEEEKQAVCIWEGVALREAADPKGKYITKINKGESITFLNEVAKDAKEKEYLKIRLNDGQEGWAREVFIVSDAVAAAFIRETDVYSRPDLLTKTKNKFSAMDIVAKGIEKEDWSEVQGKRKDGEWITKGWVKTSSLTVKAIDIATAKFGSQAMAKEGVNEQMEALKQIAENQDLSSSVFINQINEIIESGQDEAEAAAVDAIESMVESAIDSAESVQN